MTDPLLFALTVLVILATPGPTNTLLAAAGAAGGVRASCCLPAVEAAAYLLSVCALGWAAAPLIAAFPAARMVLQGAVGLYLAWLAVKMWRQGAASPALTDASRLVSRRQVFVATLLNPKGMVFAFGVIPLQAPEAMGYLAAFAVMTVAAGGGWVCLGAALRRGLPPARVRLIPRAAALTLSGFSAVMLLSPLWAN